MSDYRLNTNVLQIYKPYLCTASCRRKVGQSRTSSDVYYELEKNLGGILYY